MEEAAELVADAVTDTLLTQASTLRNTVVLFILLKLLCIL